MAIWSGAEHLPAGARGGEEKPKGQKIKERQLEFGDRGNPIHRFAVNGVERKDTRRRQRHRGGAKHFERDQEDEENHSHVRQKIGQVESQRM